MSESGLYKELRILTKKKEQWEENIPYISSLLSYESVKIQAKALWLHWTDLFRFADDEETHVSLSFIWASENITTTTPDIYENHMMIFEKLLYDPDDKVRMEAPEIFRVLGKRKPEIVRPFAEELRRISETDSNRVVRIHCLGSIKAARC